MRTAILIASLLLAFPASATGRSCDPVSLATKAQENEAAPNAFTLQSIGEIRASAIYAGRFVELLANTTEDAEPTAQREILDRWLPRHANRHVLAGGSPLRIAARLPRESRAYIFYAKQSDGEIRLIYPNQYEGPSFKAAEPENAESGAPPEVVEPRSRFQVPGADSPYIFFLSPQADRYVVHTIMVRNRLIPPFEEALRAWFDPREPFPLMRKDKSAFAGFLKDTAQSCSGEDFQSQRLFVTTYPAG